MLRDSPSIGAGTVALKDDTRVLTVVKFLRTTNTNELPQLLNILLGEMSIVSLRPQTPQCFDVFPEFHKEVIVGMRPGLSGLGQIVFRNEENILGGPKDSVSFYDELLTP